MKPLLYSGFAFCLQAFHRARSASGAALGIGLVSLLGAAAAVPPQFQPATPLLNGPATLVVGAYAIPCVADWNGDGRKDLLVGYRTIDKVALFLNQGTDSQPAFTNYSNLQAGGVDLYVAGASSCGAPAPWVCDFDADGRRDLLVGSGLNGTVNFYHNTNTDADPRLAPAVQLLCGTTPLSVSSRATPCFHDWDEDGRPDLLCGELGGTIYWFRNTNTASAPIFAPGVQLRSGSALISFYSRSVPRVADWDGDGLKDLVGSSMYGVYWCRNTNRNDNPMLEPAVALNAPLSGQGLRPITISSRMRLDVVDWNNDGVLDLVLGTAEGQVLLYEGYRFGLGQITGTDTETMTISWASAPYLKYQLDACAALGAGWTPVATSVPAANRRTSWSGPWRGDAQFFRVQVVP